MRLRSDLLIIFLLSLMPAWGQRIMSYNIQHGHGMDAIRSASVRAK